METYHPMLELLVQQGVSPVLQAGSSPHELLGMRPYEMTEATTTPMGWE